MGQYNAALEQPLLFTMLKWLGSFLRRPRDIEVMPPAVAPEHTDDATLESLLVEAMKEAGIASRETADGVVLENGLRFSLEYLESQPIGGGALRTLSKISSWHPLFFPDGLFEFQHASGATEVESLLNGFRTWTQTDLATLMDAVTDEDRYSLVMNMSLPLEEGRPDIPRKIYMGPYVHHAATGLADGTGEDESHCFCPCCLFTNSFEAFNELLASEAFFGIRLYACRHADGSIAADCRVNGEDFPLGVEHLKKYVESWPQRGLEFRKQYVVIRRGQ